MKTSSCCDLDKRWVWQIARDHEKMKERNSSGA